MKSGDLIPLATLGTTMPDGRIITARGILGIESHGMLCSGTELGLTADADGILIDAATLKILQEQMTAFQDWIVRMKRAYP